MTDLAWDGVQPLVSALDDASPAVRTAALRALARLPLSLGQWGRIGERMKQLFCGAPEGNTFATWTVHGIPHFQIINAAIFVPLPEVRECLYALLQSGDGEVRRAAAFALAKAGDGRALGELVSRVENPDTATRVEAAECLSCLDIGGHLEAIQKVFKKESDGETRFWLALAFGRLGHLRKVRRVFQELEAGAILLRGEDHDGDHEALSGRLRRPRPFPEKITAFLSGLASATPEQEEGANASGRAAFVRSVARDLLGQHGGSETPSVSVCDSGLGEEDEAALAEKARALARDLSARGQAGPAPNRPQLSPQEIELLRHLEPAEATELISAMVRQLTEEGRAGRSGTADGDGIVRLAGACTPPFTPDIATLFESYLEAIRNDDSHSVLPIQIVWLISRAEMPEILSILTPHLKARDEMERVAAAQAIEYAARLRPRTNPPVSGDTRPIGDVPVPKEPWIGTGLGMRVGRWPESGAATQWPGAMPRPPFDTMIGPSPARGQPLGATSPQGRNPFLRDYSMPTARPPAIDVRDIDRNARAVPWAGRVPVLPRGPPVCLDITTLIRPPAPPPADAGAHRVVNTGFSALDAPDDGLDRMTPLAPAADYYFWLQVGEPDPHAIDTTPTPLPPLEEGAILTVILFGYRDGIEIAEGADTGVLRVCEREVLVEGLEGQPLFGKGLLPASKRISNRLFFPIRTPATAGPYRLRCNIYHKGVLLQARLVKAEVAMSPTGQVALQTDLLPDYVLTKTFDQGSLEKLPEHRLSILLNSNGDGTRNFFIGITEEGKTEPGRLDVNSQDLEKIIGRARASLRMTAWGYEDECKNDRDYRYANIFGEDGRELITKNQAFDQLETDLIVMAQKGWALYGIFNAEQKQKIRSAIARPALIEIAMKDAPRYYFPAAMVYDYLLLTGPPGPDEKPWGICPTFREAFLAEGRSLTTSLEECACFRGECQTAQDQDPTTVCPGGFWGFRHLLGIPLSAGDHEGELTIPIRGNLKVTAAVAQSTDRDAEHLAELEKIGKDPSSQPLIGTPTWSCAKTRKQLLSLMKEKESPHIVYFYCHGKLTDHGDLPYLEFGPTDQPARIFGGDLEASRVVWTSPRPLIFLNGCHTAAVDPTDAINFVEPLLETAHGAGLIGTEITVFESMATAFAEEYLRHFLKGKSIGEAVRSARIKLLSAGNPLGLVYIPFAYAGLKLEKAAT